MKGSEFIKRVLKLAKRQDVVPASTKSAAKAAMSRLYYGNNRTVVRNPKDELKTRTFNAMLKQLGLSRDEI